MDLASPCVEAIVVDILADSDQDFDPPLSGRVNVAAYVAKIRACGHAIGGFVDGCLVGFVGFYCNDEIAHVGVVTIMAVKPGFRNYGLGTQLMAAALAAARRSGMTRVRLQTSATSRVVRLYERLGFRIVEAAPERAGGKGVILEYVFAGDAAGGR